jgi:hypothetical protein
LGDVDPCKARCGGWCWVLVMVCVGAGDGAGSTPVSRHSAVSCVLVVPARLCVV